MAFPASSVLRRYTLGLALLLALAACSSLQLAYNHGDTLLYWWLDGYVDFDRDQKSWVKKDIRQLFQWHRSTQLQDYAQFLQNSQQQHLNNPTDTARLLASYEDIKQRSQLVLLRAVPELADLLRSLRPEQISALERKFAANNAEFRQKAMSGDLSAQQKYRYEKTLEQLELWFGDFSREQQRQIRLASDARPLNNALVLEQRQRRQLAIVALAHQIEKEKPERERCMEWLRTMIHDSFQQMGPGQRPAYFDEYEAATAQMVLNVIRLATPAQKAHASQRIQGWVHDLHVLAQQGQP